MATVDTAKDRPLTVRQAADAAVNLGLKVSWRQMARWADEGKLPFKKSELDGKLYIGFAALKEGLKAQFNYDPDAQVAA